MLKISIIGGGFSGMMTAVQLIEKSLIPIEISIIEKNKKLGPGLAYSSYSNEHYLNVKVSGVSAFENYPDHFLNWIISQKLFPDKNLSEIGNLFVPRNLYGKYLSSVWNEAKKRALEKNISINVINENAIDLCLIKNEILLAKGEKILFDKCVLATGNDMPGNLDLIPTNIFSHEMYFQNPWIKSAVENTTDKFPILLIGNGLTMVDTVIGLLENGFEGKIISLSPHGFNIFPHKKIESVNMEFINQWGKLEPKNLYELVKLFNYHRHLLQQKGQGPEALIETLRPYAQEIWKNFLPQEKKLFFTRIRHLWGVARHRIPPETHYLIKSLEKNNRLEIIAGKIKRMENENEKFRISYYCKTEKKEKEIHASRIINCTGPQTDLTKSTNKLLKQLFTKGIIQQDPLKLGISTNLKTFNVIGKNEIDSKKIFTIGVTLKGELWESTAVREIRVQAEKLAHQLLRN